MGGQGIERRLGVGWMVEPNVVRGSWGQMGWVERVADGRLEGLWMQDINGGKRVCGRMMGVGNVKRWFADRSGSGKEVL